MSIDKMVKILARVVRLNAGQSEQYKAIEVWTAIETYISKSFFLEIVSSKYGLEPDPI